MEVIGIDQMSKQKRKSELLEVLDAIKQQIEQGEIQEFAAASIDSEGEVQIHVCVKDSVGAIGLYELGKNIFISQI
jgi:DNA polymerase/3'-5' exonuclease PolX